MMPPSPLSPFDGPGPHQGVFRPAHWKKKKKLNDSQSYVSFCSGLSLAFCQLYFLLL